jgi:hypothetical protein
MPIQSFKAVPKDPAEWDRFFRETPVTPSTDSVDGSSIKDGAVSEPKLADDAVSTRTLADNAVNDVRLRDSNGCSVIGRSANTTGDPADIIVLDGQFLGRRSNVLGSYALVESDIPNSIARDTEVSAAITAHEGAPDPHPGYLTQTEADARYRELTDAVTYAELTGKPAALALLFSGAGSPETVVTAGVGSLYLRTDGGAGTTLYVKESGAGNTGWIAK